MRRRAVLIFALCLLGGTLAGRAEASTCSPAAAQGPSGPSDFRDYCWLDFSGYVDATAQSAGGQSFVFTMPDGSTLAMTLTVSTNKANPALVVAAVPTWTGAAIGHTGFNNIPGNPVLYEKQSGSTVHVTLSNITVTPPAGAGATSSYAIIAADGESTNTGETLSFTTNGGAWTTVATIANGANFPTLAGVTTNTVTETGHTGGDVASYAFASFNNPTQVSSILVGTGLQGVMFAVRYASIAVSSALNLGGTRAKPSDQFTYSVSTTGGTTLASGTTTGAGVGPFTPATVPTVTAGYPFTITEAMAPGSASTLAYYATSLTCTNSATGGSTTVLPVNQTVTSYTFSLLQYGDAVSCVFTNTANRANLSIAKTGTATVLGGGAVSYSLVAQNTGPLAANGALITDPAVANFTASSVTCTAATGGAACPGSGLTIANLQGAGIAIPTFPSGGSVTLLVTGTAGGANISNTAAIAAPVGTTNSNATPTSTALTTVTAVADVAAAAAFPASVNAGQPVSGTVTFTNLGPSTAAGTVFTMTLTANLATAPTLTGLPLGATYSYAASTGVVTFAGMPTTLASGASVGPITINYTQPPAGTSTVTAAVSTTTIDSNLANNSVTVAIPGNPIADVAAAAAFPASVNAGQPVSGTVTFTNNGPSTAAGTAFTMTLTANLATAPTLSGLPLGATYSYAASTGIVTLAGMPTTLAAGSTVGPITINYTQPPAGTSTVTAAVSTTTIDSNLANNSVTRTIAGNPVADVAAAAAFPASVNAGQPVAGTVTFTNNGPSTAAGTAFTMTLTANLATTPTLTGLPLGATYSYTASSGIVTLAGMPATLAAGSTVGPIAVNYTQPPAGTSTVTAAVSTTTTDPNLANNSVTVTITGNPIADVAAAAAFPASVNAGQPVAGTVTFTNLGPSTAAGTAFTMTLTANLATAPTLSGLPLGATYSYAAGTGVITLNAMPTTLAAGASVGPITVRYTQPPSGASALTAAVSTTTSDPNLANNSVAVSIAGNPVADMAAAAAFPASVNAGQPVAGTVTFTNLGPSTAAGASFTLTLSANLATAPTLSGLPLGATYSYAASTGIVTLSGMPTTLAAGGAVGPITIRYTQPGTASSTVVASATSSTLDSNLANNTATANISGGLSADVSASAAFPASVNAGQPVAGTVTFTNAGPSIAAGTAFTMTLPANLATAPTLSGLPLGATYSYNPSTGVVTLTGMPATLASGASVGPITIKYTQPPAGASTVTAGVSTTTIDPNPGNNTVSVTVSGNPVADVAASATFPASVNAGQPVSGSVTFKNNGPSTATGTSFTLNLTANLAAPPTLSGLPLGASYSYVASTGIVTLSGMPTTLATGGTIGPIAIRYIQPPAGTSLVTAAVATSTSDPNLANNSVSHTIAGNPVADVAAAAAFPAKVNAGQPVLGTVTFANLGPSTAIGTGFTIHLAANLGAPTLSGLPLGATYSYAAGTGVVTLSGMPTTLLAAATVGPISVRYTQPPAGTSSVTAAVSTATTDSNPANNSVTATITGAGAADVSTSGSFPTNVNAGQPVSGTLTFTNAGPSTATGTGFTITLPANLAAPPTFSGLPPGATYSYNPSTGVVTLTGMPTSLASGGSVGPITVHYIQPPAGTSTVTAAISASSPDPNSANNGTTITVAGNPVADLAASAAFPPSVNADEPVTGTVTFINLGPSTAIDTKFTLDLAANLTAPPTLSASPPNVASSHGASTAAATFAGSPTLSGLPTGAAYSYAAGTGTVTLTGMPTTLAAGASVGPITIQYMQPPSALSTVTAQLLSSTSDPNLANNRATVRIAGSANQVTGSVFIDANHNGTLAPGDSPVAGTVVKLLSGTRVVATTTTTTAGTYFFAGQPPGSYQVVFVPTAGYIADTPGVVAVIVGSAGATVVNFGEVTDSSLGSLVLEKTTPLMNISAGQSVPYTITATNPGSAALFNATVTDLVPAGFRYRSGSGAVNGVRQNPSVNGRELSWTGLRFAPGEKKTFTLVLTPGTGVAGGEYVNQASAFNNLTHALISNIATATVRIVGDPTFDCPDLIGKVFDDANANGVQDPGEKGIAGVRLVTAQGLIVTTDAEGRYHITCPVIPDTAMGSNFIVKVDERTLPSGYRMTTDNPETVRLTAGKVTKLNFGATIHRVVRIEVSASAFEGTVLDAAVSARLDTLIGSLVDEAAILRLAYAATNEPPATVDLRLKALREAVTALWKTKGCRYPLRIEEDFFRTAVGPDAGRANPP
jgi:uncharacterized repeat protein (TIGR01451 family)